jgi:hypothetical protein
LAKRTDLGRSFRVPVGHRLAKRTDLGRSFRVPLGQGLIEGGYLCIAVRKRLPNRVDPNPKCHSGTQSAIHPLNSGSCFRVFLRCKQRKDSVRKRFADSKNAKAMSMQKFKMWICSAQLLPKSENTEIVLTYIGIMEKNDRLV